MSCIALPDCPKCEADEFDPANDAWPELVQGLRVYAVRQPPKVASELLQWARLAELFAAIEVPHEGPQGS
jgi:hypothetical protein